MMHLDAVMTQIMVQVRSCLEIILRVLIKSFQAKETLTNRLLVIVKPIP